VRSRRPHERDDGDLARRLGLVAVELWLGGGVSLEQLVAFFAENLVRRRREPLDPTPSSTVTSQLATRLW
jgi:hypothetical protein